MQYGAIVVAAAFVSFARYRWCPTFPDRHRRSPIIPSCTFKLSTILTQVICEKVEKSDIATIDKKKYLVPADLTVGQFVYVIRKRIKLSPEKAIFIFVDEVLPPTAALMSSIYEEHKDEDGYVLSSGTAVIILSMLICLQLPVHHLLGREHLRRFRDGVSSMTSDNITSECSRRFGLLRFSTLGMVFLSRISGSPASRGL